MTLLPNMRLLGLPSEEEGRDWADLIRRVDHKIEETGYDLAEETIVIEFHDGEVKVYRPVIGGRKDLAPPWLLTDRTAAQVRSKVLEGEYWDEILDEIDEENFTLMLKRRYEGELRLSAQVFFSFF